MGYFTHIQDGMPIPRELITDNVEQIRWWINQWLEDWGLTDLVADCRWEDRRIPDRGIGFVGYCKDGDIVAGVNFTGRRMLLPNVEFMTRPDKEV